MLGTSNEIRNPGLRALPPGVEKYFVKGGGLSVIEVFPEDEIEIINDEGKQICEIIVFNNQGKPDLSILNLKEIANADFSKRTIAKDEKISNIFKKRNLDLQKAKSSILFDEDCLMGEKIILSSKDKCFVLIAAPGDPLNVHEHLTDHQVLLLKQSICLLMIKLFFLPSNNLHQIELMILLFEDLDFSF